MELKKDPSYFMYTWGRGGGGVCLLALDVLNRIITLELLSSEAVVECRGEMKPCCDIYINK